jgi:RNA polymerase sigma-70 factor (ECF subfamily)
MTASDLELAAACARGEDAALAELEERHWPEMKRALARLRLGDAAIDEILQRVRTKLFVGEPPRIATYGGKGPLAGWLRAIAVHEALSDKRAEKRRPEDGVSAIERMAVPEQPEIAALRAQYAAPFEAAFGEALGSLSPRDRNVLRLVYLEGLTAEQVALAYGVHRVSVARWLGQIRESLFDRTRTLLKERLALGTVELESVTRLCLSELDVSLDRLLQSSQSR